MNTQQELRQAYNDYQRTQFVVGHGMEEIPYMAWNSDLPFMQMELSKEEAERHRVI